MKKGILLTLITIMAFSFMSLPEGHSAPGDTVRVVAKDTLHWRGYGGYFTTADFPEIDETKYRKIWLKATLGCPDIGCSQWDYTTMFDIMDPSVSGKETLLPAFKVNGEIRDSVKFKRSATYHYVYENGNRKDSFEVNPLNITTHDRSPRQEVNSYNFWQGDTYIFDYNRSDVLDSIDVDGNDTTFYYTDEPNEQNAVDSHMVGSDTAWINEVQTIQGEAIEIGRAATPYSGTKQQGWTYPWYFDVTDYQMLMDGETQLRAFYRGPRDGFTIKMEFIMIEGTPPRDPVSVQNIYNSPETGFYYSFDTSDINNDRLVPTELAIPQNASEGKIRVSIKGHGFGEAGGNCAEFCRKYYKVFLNEEEFGKKYIWRNDCDMTPVYPQTGTWILSRTNWCPGTESFPDDHELTDLTTPGDSFTFEMNVEPHQFIEPNRDYTDPRWVTDVQFITYGEKNFTNDVAMERVIAPSDNPIHGRYNPICDNAIVEIKNTGSEPLTSATLRYGDKNGPKKTFEWQGNLKFMDSDTVNLPAFGAYSAMFQGGPFEVVVSNPNGQEDEYELNNQMFSTYDEVPEYPEEILFTMKTNEKPPGAPSNYAPETYWSLTDAGGNVVEERKPEDLDFNTLYNDTFRLDHGCYALDIKERLGQRPYGIGDGLDYFCSFNSQLCNQEGVGKAGLRGVGSPIAKDLPYSFEKNFGRMHHHEFTVGYQVGQDEPEEQKAQLNIYPNPANNSVNFNLKLKRIADLQVQITSTMGQTVKTQQISGYNNEGFSIDISNLAPGVYIAEVNDGQETYQKRFVKQ